MDEEFILIGAPLPANHPALSFIFSTSLKGEKSSKSSHLI
jgi:hypothetical protein